MTKKFFFLSPHFKVQLRKKEKANPLRTNWVFEQFWVFTSCSRIQFFNSLPFLTQLVQPPLVPYHLLSSTCMTYRTSYHSIGHQVRSTQLLRREAQDFPRGRKYSRDVPLLTSHLKVLPGRFYLCPRASHGTLYQSITDFEPAS